MMASPGRLPLGRGSASRALLGMLCALALSTSASVAQSPKASATLGRLALMHRYPLLRRRSARSRQSSSASAVNRRKRVVAAGSAEAMLTYREDRSVTRLTFRITEAVAAIPASLYRTGKAEFVSIRIKNVEIPLAPRSVAWRERGLQAGGYSLRILCINIINVKDRAPPPTPYTFWRHHDQIQIAATGVETGETCRRTTVFQSEPQRLVKQDRASHVVCGQCDGTDACQHYRPLCLQTRQHGTFTK